MSEYETSGAGWGVLVVVIGALILIVALVASVSVVANKIGDAQSLAIVSDAQQRATDAEHKRTLEQKEFNARLPAIEAEAEEDVAFSQMLSEVWVTLTWIVPIALAIILFPLSATLSIGLAFAVPFLIIAFVVTRRKRMELNARLIYIDKETGLFPIITERVGGVLCIDNPNTGEIAVINGNRAEPIPHLITGQSYVQAAGVLGRYASIAKPGNAESVADINPPLIVDNTASSREL